MKKLFIFTLNWEGEDKLKKLAPTLLNSLQDIDYQWFIKDNNSQDKSIEYLTSLNNDKIQTFAYKNNAQNFSEGMNFLFNETKPQDDDYILLLNNDVIINDKMSIKNMIDIMNNDPAVGVVGARLLFTNTNKLQHAGVVFNPNHLMPIHFRTNQVSDNDALKNREFQVVTGAVLLTQAKYYKNVSETGMDQNYRWAFDDVDLALSIKYNMNKKIVYCGNTNIFHEESASLKKNPVNKLFLPHNVSYFKNKWKNKYILDQGLYAKDPKYKLYEKP